MKDLIERIEKAEAGSRELDAEIAVALYGGEIIWKQANYTMEVYPARRAPSPNHVGGFANNPVEYFTTSVDAALTLRPEGLAWAGEFSDYNYANFWLDTQDYDGRPLGEGRGNSPALAICAAALRARESQ